jgi:hypothetical protein
VGDAGVEQYAVGAELHRDGHVAGGADAGVDDYGVVGVVLLQQFQAE